MPRRKRAGAPATCPGCDALEAVIHLQNGAMDEMGRLIDRMPGGLVASLKAILERHGVKFQPDRPGLQ